MNLDEIKRYFESTPPPQEVQWKPWAKISDTQKFLNSCYTGISNFNGTPDMYPAWWHLKDLYYQVKRNNLQEINTETQTQ